MTASPCRITLLAGGVGGAKMAEGLAASRFAAGLSVIGNIGDDHDFHGLWISPDIDTLTYTLADLVDREQGWGLEHDSFRTLGALARLGAETWMYLGDLDLATHIFRTQLRRQGVRPTEIARTIGTRLGVKVPVLLPSDDFIRTRIHTETGWLDFQEYFVRERCRPVVLDVDVTGAQQAKATPEALSAIREADLIVVAPSNPVVSIGPILAIPGIAEALRASTATRVAVSPLVGGRPLKGPADDMLRALGFRADPLGVADFYSGVIDALVIDRADAGCASALHHRGIGALVADTVMHGRADKVRLAESLVDHFNQRQRRAV